jgi:hypothetical protein
MCFSALSCRLETDSGLGARRPSPAVQSIMLFLMTFSHVVYFIFIVRNSLALPNSCMHGQRHIIAVRAPRALQKPLQKCPKMRPLAQSQLRAMTMTTELKRLTYMKRVHDARVAEAPHLGVCAQHKVKLAQRNYTLHETACELRNKRTHFCRLGRDGLCNVLGPQQVQAGTI